MTDLQATATGAAPFPIQPKLDVMEATRTSWRVFRGQAWSYIMFLFVPLLVYIALVVVMMIILVPLGLVAGKDSAAGAVVGTVVALIVWVVQTCAQMTVQLAALWGAARNMEGARFAFEDAFRAGFRRVLPGVGLVLLMLLIIGVGYLLLIVPGIIVAGFLVLAPAACVIERRGPIESMKRSFALVTDNWWRCFATLLLTIVLPLLAFAATALLIFLVFKAMGIPALAFILVLPAFPFFIVLAAMSMVVPAVLFVELRALKEGRAAGSVAGVFA